MNQIDIIISIAVLLLITGLVYLVVYLTKVTDGDDEVIINDEVITDDEVEELEHLWIAVGAGQDFLTPSNTNRITGGGKILRSNNGKQWSQLDDFPIQTRGIAYGGDLWVAVGRNNTDTDNYKNILHSLDGRNWIQSNTSGASFNNFGQGVAYGITISDMLISTPLWVAVGNDNNAHKNILHSSDGRNWIQSNTNGASFNIYGAGVAYGKNRNNPLWVAVGRNNDDYYKNILWSDNGKTWEKSNTSGTSFVIAGFGVAYGTSNGTTPLWVAVGMDNGNTFKNILWSDNGKHWNESNTSGASFNNSGRGIAYGTSDGSKALWVAVGTNSGGAATDGNNNILWSNDGKQWEESSGASFKHYANSVAYSVNNGTPLWVAVGNNPGTDNGNDNILWSDNGKHWHESDSGNASFENAAGLGVAGNHLLYGMDKSYYH